MNKGDYQHYISGSVKLGVSFSVISLLARWITGSTILSTPEILIKYSLAGVIGFSLMGGLSLIIFGALAKKIRKNFPNSQTIGDALRVKLPPFGYWYMISILLITSFSTLLIQALGTGILLHTISPIPVFIGMLIFLAYCFVIGGLGGMNWLHKMAGINVIIIFGAVIIIPVYFFIQEGVRPVYEGIKLYHPYILFIKNTDSIWFIIAAILIGTGQVLIDRATWERVFIIREDKIRTAFTMAGVIWTTIPFALSSLVMIIIFGRSYHNINTLIFHLIDKIQPPLLIILFVLFCFSAFSAAISSDLQATTALFVKNVLLLFKPISDQDKWKFSFLFSGIVCLILLLIVSILTPSLLQLLFLFGNIYAAIICPMIYIVLSKKTLPSIVPLASLFGAAGGYFAQPLINDLRAFGISFLISAIVCLGVFINKSVKRR